MTLIVNLFGAPGAGKSTIAARVFSDLKMMGYNVEYTPEYAKDLTWEKRYHTLKNQVYVFGKQLQRIHRLEGQVEAIITDSPLLLSLIYSKDYPESWKNFVLDIWYQHKNINYYLERKKPYNPKGRNQTEEESDKIGTLIWEMLEETCSFETYHGSIESAVKIVDQVTKKLNESRFS